MDSSQNEKASFLSVHPLKNNHTPAKCKLIYSAHYNHFSLIQTTEGWTWKPLEEALAESVYVFRQMAADTPFYVAVMSSDVSCPLKME